METKPTYETKALTVAQPLTPTIWQMILGVAETVHKSRIFGTGSEAEAASIMLKGYELGLPLTASFEFIYAITVGGKTRASLSPRGHLALIHGSPLCAKIEIEDIADDQGQPWACRAYMERTSGYSYEITVTMDDAHRAKLVKPGSGWENWPANMLRARAIGFCADVVFPDIGGGMKRTDELAPIVNQEGEPVHEDPWNVVSTSTPPEPTEPRIDMGYLVDNWGVDLILKVNGGNIPSTQADIEWVCTLLREQYPRDEVF